MAQNKFLQADSTFYVKIIYKITTLASNNVLNVERDKNISFVLCTISQTRNQIVCKTTKEPKMFPSLHLYSFSNEI